MKMSNPLILGITVLAFLSRSAAAQVNAQEESRIKFGNVRINGLLQGWYVADQKAGARDAFSLRRAEIKLSGQAHPFASWFVVIDPAKPLNIKTAAQGGSITSAHVDPKTMILKDAALVLSAGDRFSWASLQVGQFKPPFGMEGIESSAKLDTVERAAQSAVLGWSDYRDLGAMIKLNRGPWQAYLGIFNGEGPNTTDENEEKDLAGKIAFEPTKNIHLGVSGYKGKGKAARFPNERWGLEAAWNPNPWSFKAELAAGHGATSESASPGRQTAYGQAGYFFLPKLQGILRYDWWEPNSGQGRDIQNEIVVGLNYLIDGHNFKIQANYVFHNEEGPSAPNDVMRVALQVGF